MSSVRPIEPRAHPTKPMSLRCTLSCLLFFVPARGLLAQAAVEGRVTLPTTHSAPVVNKRYEIVTKGGVIATNTPLAVVYLEGKFSPPLVPPLTQIAQKDLTFFPTLLAVQAGTRVEFPNFDDTYHNIFSFSPAKRFDLGRYRADEKPVPSVVFDEPGLVTLRCDIHEHMRALILVLPTPHFVITDADGRYRLGGLPPGRYAVRVWLDSRTTSAAQPVELRDGATVRVDFP